MKKSNGSANGPGMPGPYRTYAYVRRVGHESRVNSPKKIERKGERRELRLSTFFMSSMRKDRTPQPADSTGLAALVDGVRGGDREAAEVLHSILAPGVRFLLRQQLESGDIDHESSLLIEAAIREIQSDVSLRASDVLSMVRKRIRQRSGRKSAGTELSPAIGAHGPAIRLAQDILGRMSTVERDALRRCYVLRQRPEIFLQGLGLSPEQFRAIQSRARSEFNASKPPNRNVA